MNNLLFLGIVIGISLIVGIISGNGAVYAFNHMPAKWLCDYGQEPSEKILSKDGQRVKSFPWKWVFTASFIVIGIYVGTTNWFFAIPFMISLWILLEITIADILYGIIPDELVLFLAITAFGYIPFHQGYIQLLWGMLLGGGSLFFLGFFGKKLFKRDSMGFGDVKLAASLGLILGFYGIGLVLLSSLFFAGIAGATLLITKKKKTTDALAFGPFLTVSTTIYMIFYMINIG